MHAPVDPQIRSNGVSGQSALVVVVRLDRLEHSVWLPVHRCAVLNTIFAAGAGVAWVATSEARQP